MSSTNNALNDNHIKAIYKVFQNNPNNQESFVEETKKFLDIKDNNADILDPKLKDLHKELNNPRSYIEKIKKFFTQLLETIGIVKEKNSYQQGQINKILQKPYSDLQKNALQNAQIKTTQKNKSNTINDNELGNVFLDTDRKIDKLDEIHDISDTASNQSMTTDSTNRIKDQEVDISDSKSNNTVATEQNKFTSKIHKELGNVFLDTDRKIDKLDEIHDISDTASNKTMTTDSTNSMKDQEVDISDSKSNNTVATEQNKFTSNIQKELDNGSDVASDNISSDSRSNQSELYESYTDETNNIINQGNEAIKNIKDIFKNIDIEAEEKEIHDTLSNQTESELGESDIISDNFKFTQIIDKIKQGKVPNDSQSNNENHDISDSKSNNTVATEQNKFTSKIHKELGSVSNTLKSSTKSTSSSRSQQR